MSDRSIMPVIDAVRDMLEITLPAGSSVDNSGSEPYMFTEKTLYVYEDGLEERIAAGMQVEQRFEIVAVYASVTNPEEAAQTRTRVVTEALSSLRDQWFAAIAAERAREDELWSDIIGRADHDLIRALEVRGFAVRLLGRRFITE